MFTPEQLDQHAAKIDIKAMQPGGANHFTQADVKAAPEQVIGKVCTVYQKVRPFLEVIGNLFFVPKKWREAILAFTTVMDGLCPNPDL